MTIVIEFKFLNVLIGREQWNGKKAPKSSSMKKEIITIEITVNSSEFNRKKNNFLVDLIVLLN